MQNLWKQVADQYCTSAEEVQAEIAEAIRQGMNNLDADVQQAWAEIPRQQDELQPEDVVAWIAAQLLLSVQKLQQSEGSSQAVCRYLRVYGQIPEQRSYFRPSLPESVHTRKVPVLHGRCWHLAYRFC